MSKNSFGAASTLRVGDADYYESSASPYLEEKDVGNISRLPFSTKILLENLLRYEDGRRVTAARRRLCGARASAVPTRRKSASCRPACCCRTSPACPAWWTSPPCATPLPPWAPTPSAPTPSCPPTWSSITPSRWITSAPRTPSAQRPARVSAQSRTLHAPALGPDRVPQFPRGAARYRHRAPGQPRIPGLGRLPRRAAQAYPDTLVGTDSHTTMINGLGVLGLGRGRHRGRSLHARPAHLHAAAAGGRLQTPRPPAGRLHRHRPGPHHHPDPAQERRGRQVRRVLRHRPQRAQPGRPRHRRQHGPRVRRHHGLLPGRRTRPSPTCASPTATPAWSSWWKPTPRSRACSAPTQRPTRSTPNRSNSTSPPSCLPWPGPSGRRTAWNFRACARTSTMPSPARRKPRRSPWMAIPPRMENGAVVIAAITSCTNTSNPSVMLGAGLLAKKAVERGLTVKPWVKTSLAPGSKVVTDYYRQAGLLEYLEAAQLPPGRLRLHHLHRQQRPAARTGRRGRAEGEPGGGRRAQRQPQLRRPHQSAGQGQLPRLAAAGGRLRARRHASISTSPASRSAQDPAGKPVYLARHLAFQRRSAEHGAHGRQTATCSSTSTPRPSKATPTGSGMPVPTGGTFEWDEQLHLHQEAALLRQHGRSRRPGRRTSAACASWRCWAIPSPPTTSRPPAPSPRTARPENI